MADAPAYTNYQLSATTLATMKEAAGNYMPDYGNWRYIAPPVKEEEEEEEEEEEQEEEQEEEGLDTDDKSTEVNDDVKTGSASRTWGDKGGTVNEFAKNCHNADGSRREGHIYTNSKGNRILCAWDDSGDYESKNDSVHNVTTKDNRGGADVTYDIDPESGEYTNVQEETWGDQEGYTPFEKRSPYKTHEGEPHPNTSVRPGSFADPLSGVELKAARQAIIDRGSTASTHYHDQAKEIVKDIKANMFQKEGDEKTKKDNQTKSHATMKTLSTGIQNLFGPDGAVENFVGLYDDGNISEGFRNKGVMAKILKGDPDVRLGVTPENNIVLQVPTPEGEMMAISASDINDFSEKAVTQYAFGVKASSGYSALIDAGRSGLPYDSDSVKTESRRLLKELGPNGLASVMGDKGIITDEPLIKHAGEAYWADADVDSWNLIHEAMQTEEGEDGLLELGIQALEQVAFKKHAMGFAEFQKENSNGLDAKALLDKYA